MSIWSDLRVTEDEDERRFLEDILKWEARMEDDISEDDYEDEEDEE